MAATRAIGVESADPVAAIRSDVKVAILHRRGKKVATKATRMTVPPYATACAGHPPPHIGEVRALRFCHPNFAVFAKLLATLA